MLHVVALRVLKKSVGVTTRLLLVAVLATTFVQECSAQYQNGARVVRRSPVHTTYRPVYPSRTAAPKTTRYSTSSRRAVGTGDSYRLGDGDTLGIIVDGVLGKFGEDAPVHMPDSKDSDIQPGIGYPVIVRKGTLSLPLIDPVAVRGLTVVQAQKKISNAYRREKILKNDNRVMVSLVRKRRVSVTVVHDDVDALGSRFGSQPYASLFQTPRKKVSSVTLPADRAHLLDALSAAVADLDSEQVVQILNQHRRAVRDGDVVNVQSPPRQFFYTGGLMPAGEFPIPRDRRLNAMQAIAMAGGSFRDQRSGLGPSNLVITRQNGRSIRIDYDRLRANPNAVQILPGDSLMLQYKPREAIGNAAGRVIGLRGLGL